MPPVLLAPLALAAAQKFLAGRRDKQRGQARERFASLYRQRAGEGMKPEDALLEAALTYPGAYDTDRLNALRQTRLGDASSRAAEIGLHGRRLNVAATMSNRLGASEEATRPYTDFIQRDFGIANQPPAAPPPRVFPNAGAGVPAPTSPSGAPVPAPSGTAPPPATMPPPPAAPAPTASAPAVQAMIRSLDMETDQRGQEAAEKMLTDLRASDPALYAQVLAALRARGAQ